jgi:hypothetical protein
MGPHLKVNCNMRSGKFFPKGQNPELTDVRLFRIGRPLLCKGSRWDIPYSINYTGVEFRSGAGKIFPQNRPAAKHAVRTARYSNSFGTAGSSSCNNFAKVAKESREWGEKVIPFCGQAV